MRSGEGVWSRLLFVVHENVIDGFAVRSDTALSDCPRLSVAGYFPFLGNKLFAFEVADPLERSVIDALYRHSLSGNRAVASFSSRIFLSIVLGGVRERRFFSACPHNV